LRSFARTVGPPPAAGPRSLLHPCRGRSGGSRWSMVGHRHVSTPVKAAHHPSTWCRFVGPGLLVHTGYQLTVSCGPSSIGLCSVLRPLQHSIGYMGDCFYRSKDPTNSIKVLKEATKENKNNTKNIIHTETRNSTR